LISEFIKRRRSTEKNPTYKKNNAEIRELELGFEKEGTFSCVEE